MFLIDTNVISEARNDDPLILLKITIVELRHGVDLIRHRGDQAQAGLLESWLEEVLQNFGHRILDLVAEAAQVWGRLRVPHPHNFSDKQIAVIALLHYLTVVTRNGDDFAGTGVTLLNPFAIA